MQLVLDAVAQMVTILGKEIFNSNPYTDKPIG